MWTICREETGNVLFLSRLSSTVDIMFSMAVSSPHDHHTEPLGFLSLKKRFQRLTWQLWCLISGLDGDLHQRDHISAIHASVHDHFKEPLPKTLWVCCRPQNHIFPPVILFSAYQNSGNQDATEKQSTFRFYKNNNVRKGVVSVSAGGETGARLPLSAEYLWQSLHRRSTSLWQIRNTKVLKWVRVWKTEARGLYISVICLKGWLWAPPRSIYKFTAVQKLTIRV